MPPPLPFDVLEHIIQLLRRDKRTLAACCLVCREFKTIASPLIVPWSEVSLTPSDKCLETPSVKQFLDDMAANPEQAASYDQLTLSYESEEPQRSPPPVPVTRVIEMLVALCNHLPEVRDLRLESFRFNEPALCGLLTVAGRIPTIESLSLYGQDFESEQSPLWPHASVESWSASAGGSSRWALQRLVLFGAASLRPSYGAWCLSSSNRARASLSNRSSFARHIPHSTRP
ncbi:hypothetical protein NUW54_g8126 [Trametes sanguinea]|uniref:Uncharacterized protein n=1 Tax=Trametes sanguinea TaxID=158606 RepID=A0ACC1PGT4_9APHY|nr:hypothetical protein NUW54_g8126 [Trametes sanguinea]